MSRDEHDAEALRLTVLQVELESLRERLADHGASVARQVAGVAALERAATALEHIATTLDPGWVPLKDGDIDSGRRRLNLLIMLERIAEPLSALGRLASWVRPFESHR